MKFIKYLLIAILVLVALFFAKGFFSSPVSYECSVEVNKSAAQAWASMNNEENLPKWISGYKRSELVSGTEGTVGAVSKVYIEEEGREQVMQETITALEAEKRMAMSFTMDFMDMDYEMIFNEAGGKTVITTSSTSEGNGLFAKSMLSFMHEAMKSQEEKNLANLKKVIEEGS